jgi:hypothetical protein
MIGSTRSTRLRDVHLAPTTATNNKVINNTITNTEQPPFNQPRQRGREARLDGAAAGASEPPAGKSLTTTIPPAKSASGRRPA